MCRLTQASSADALTITFQYAYDPVGNRTVQTRTITSTQVITYQYDLANRMTQFGGVTYTWDNNGNLTNDGSATYLYDRANRLISTTLSGVTSLYAYNGDGSRLKQTVAGTVTTYTQDLAASLPVILQAKTGSATKQYLYALGTRPQAQNGGAWEYLLPDALGSVRQIVDANGNVTLAKSYEPYGSVLTSTGTASSIFGYVGEQLDSYIKLCFAVWLRPSRASGFRHVGVGDLGPMWIVPQPLGQFVPRLNPLADSLDFVECIRTQTVLNAPKWTFVL